MEIEEQKRMVGRTTNESLQRQGTGDFHGRRSNKQLRFKIPLRYKRKPLQDEEKGHVDGPGPNGVEISRLSSAIPAKELLEIVSTKWLPDDEGREIVTLTVKDEAASRAPVQCESRWRHIQSDAMTFRKFYDHVARVPGLQDDDLALVARLLKKVRKTREKQWVHGRYLKPLTIVYEGEDPDHLATAPKTATFVSLPIFTTDCARRHTSTKEFEGHPVRALLQSHYRLESTKKRDKEQVITKTGFSDEKDHVIHVPQIWALIVNKYTMVTCAPLDMDTLRGDTINLITYSNAQKDEATWSIHFTDARGNVSHLPLRYCRTWFGLVKHISDDILKDEYNLIRDQLLQGGPAYKLVTREDVQVTAESWPKMVDEKQTEVIQVKLIERPLVVYCDPEGNEVDHLSDSSSETSSIFTTDDAESDTSETSTHSDGLRGSDQKLVTPAVKRLRVLHVKLNEARTQGNSTKTDRLERQKIPALEEELLNLMRDSVNKYIEKQLDSYRKDRVLEPSGYHRGRTRQLLVSPPRSPVSRSTSRPRRHSPTYKHYGHSRSDYDLPSSRYTYAESNHRPYIIKANKNRARSPYRSQHEWPDDYDMTAPPIKWHRPRSQKSDRPLLLRQSSGLQSPRERWERLRSKVLVGDYSTQLKGDDPMKPKEEDICYKPSDKQLARSRWDLLRSQVLARAIPSNNVDPIEAKEAKATPTEPTKPSKIRTAFHTVLGNIDSPTSPVSPKGTSLNASFKGSDSEAIKTSLKRKSQEMKPRLQRLIDLARQSSSTVLKEKPLSSVPEKRTLSCARNPRDIPIFLWSTNIKSGEITSLPDKSKRAPERSQIANAVMHQDVGLNNLEEIILHTVANEVHSNLMKSKKNVPEGVRWYKKTSCKTSNEVLGLLNKEVASESEFSETEEGDVAIQREQFVQAKENIFAKASNILYAFVPSDFEAAVVARYWGALFKLLTEKDDSVLDFVSDRMDELCNLVRSIQNGVRADDGIKQARYHIPLALFTAFQHIVLCLVLISNTSEWSDHSWRQMGAHFDECEGFLVEGRKQLILMVHTDDYRETTGFQAVDSEALLSLILANLVESLSKDTEFHLTDIYSEYTSKIQSVVRDQASVKVYDDIKFLREELDVIKATLRQQDDTLRDFRSTMKETYGVASLSISVMDRILESIEERIADFDELLSQAETARFLAQQSISLKAESNNKAIIVFTVVTIIFLPLSFVTSYLGMNTSDLRVMKSGQSLFWAIGAPVSFVTFSVALFAAFYGTLTQRLTGHAWHKKEKAE